MFVASVIPLYVYIRLFATKADKSYYTSTKVRLSVRHSIWGNNRLTDESGKGTMGCGSGAWLGSEENGKGETQKDAYRRHIHGIRYTFIISRKFARGRHSLIVSDLLRCP